MPLDHSRLTPAMRRALREGSKPWVLEFPRGDFEVDEREHVDSGQAAALRSLADQLLADTEELTPDEESGILEEGFFLPEEENDDLA